MRTSSILTGCIAAVLSSVCTVATQTSNLTEPLSSKQILPANFKPPQVFKNTNLVRNVNLDKSYARETINVVIENVDKSPQDTYYLPFESELLARVGAFEVRDKKDTSLPVFKSEVVGFDPARYTAIVTYTV
jgi:oligosaccharyltransferase complex subunit alpha (ribophorin I)